MKKILVGIISVLAVAALCLVMAACSATDVAGKTYEYSDVEISYNGEIPEDQKDNINSAIEQAKTTLKALYTGSSIKFNEDGTCVTKSSSGEQNGYYKQVGNKVYPLQSADAEVKEDGMYFLAEGNKLIMEGEESGMKIKVIYVQI